MQWGKRARTRCGAVGWVRVSCGWYAQTVRYLVPQVFGWAAYVCIQVRNVDKLGDAGFSGCLCNLLRDSHKDILKAIVSVTKEKQRGEKSTCLQRTNILEVTVQLHLNNIIQVICFLAWFCSVPCFPLSAHQVDDNIWVFQSLFDGVLVPRIPLLHQEENKRNPTNKIAACQVKPRCRSRQRTSLLTY